MKYADNAKYPIIAIDFDGTININGEDKFPECGTTRPWVITVTNFMHKLGIKIVIWTSRDVAYNQEEKIMYDHLTPMLQFLEHNNVKYDAVNKSIQFAPYHYNGRKVYAHMYVDDRGFGWAETEDIFLEVLRSFLTTVCGISQVSAHKMVLQCKNHEEPEPWMIDAVKNWRSNGYK